MNTASRMESNGKPEFIHISEQTAILLKEAGKSDWIEPRKDIIDVKGKGKLQTYWLTMGGASNPEIMTFTNEDSVEQQSFVVSDDPTIRWAANVLEGLLSKMNAMEQKESTILDDEDDPPIDALNELTDILPVHHPGEDSNKGEEDYQLGTSAKIELAEFIMTLAKLYNSNPFHNFSHAIHVAMATLKLLSRATGHWTVTTEYGYEGPCLASNPFLQFACVFTALIQ